jgi:uncharacterized membrane protein
MLRSFFRYFAQGLLVIVPIGITVLLLYRIFDFVSHYITAIGLVFNSYLHPIVVFLIILALVLLIGRFASTLIFQSLFGSIEKMLEHAPVVKHIYSPVKDFMGAFVGNKKKFNRPVLVMTNPAAGIEELGFITQEELSEFGAQDKIAVYIPHSYAFSGRLYIVPKQFVRTIDKISSGDTMKFIVSGGVSNPESENKSGA